LNLGRWTGTEWARATDEAESTGETAIGEGVAVGIHTLGAEQVDATTGPPAQACPDGREGPSITPNPGPPAVPGFGFGSIAFAAEWRSSPRPTAAVTSAVETFTQAGRDAFAGTVVDPVDGKVEQIVVGDLDGDGDSESLVSFGGPGYATLLLIDVDSGASVIVERSISEGQPPVDFDSFRVLAVLDMNGDGVMEFVVHSWDGGRSASASTSTVTATAYSYDGTQSDAVLEVSC
jgi:hypothetical protein